MRKTGRLSADGRNGYSAKWLLRKLTRSGARATPDRGRLGRAASEGGIRAAWARWLRDFTVPEREHSPVAGSPRPSSARMRSGSPARRYTARIGPGCRCPGAAGRPSHWCSPQRERQAQEEQCSHTRLPLSRCRFTRPGAAAHSMHSNVTNPSRSVSGSCEAFFPD